MMTPASASRKRLPGSPSMAHQSISRRKALGGAGAVAGALALAWKREGWLGPYVPADAAQHVAPGHIDPDGTFLTLRILFSVIAYNTQLVKAQDAPASFADLLDAKWTGRLVKAHPGYSGLI